MRTRTEARIWVYRDAVARALRTHLHDARLLPRGLTPAQLKRVQTEMVRLAEQLEAKATKLEMKQTKPIQG